jgi:hypothetical protein
VLFTNVTIKPRIRYAGHVTCRGRKRNTFRFLKERGNLTDLDTDDRIKLIKQTFKTWNGTARTGLIWLCVQDNEPSDSTICGEFLECLSNYQFLKKDSLWCIPLLYVF